VAEQLTLEMLASNGPINPLGDDFDYSEPSCRSITRR
jgi:hypothetical protein